MNLLVLVHYQTAGKQGLHGEIKWLTSHILGKSSNTSVFRRQCMDHFMTESLAMHQHCVQLIYAACKCAGRSSLSLSAEVNVSLMK